MSAYTKSAQNGCILGTEPMPHGTARVVLRSRGQYYRTAVMSPYAARTTEQLLRVIVRDLGMPLAQTIDADDIPPMHPWDEDDVA